jgi:hypothetical protein
LFDNGSEIVLQEICLNQKFAADFYHLNAVFLEKNANFEFCFHCGSISDSQGRFGVAFIGKLVIEFGISCVRIFR